MPLPDGMGVVDRGEDLGNVLGFGLDPSPDTLPPRDSFEAACQYSEVRSTSAPTHIYIASLIDPHPAKSLSCKFSLHKCL